jgi:hypothetical protein
MVRIDNYFSTPASKTMGYKSSLGGIITGFMVKKSYLQQDFHDEFT